ncbi:glycosyltransferase family 17 protein, partial [Piromyces sp. E2]
EDESEDENEDESEGFNVNESEYYHGYSYTDNSNDEHKGEGYLGEFARFGTKKKYKINDEQVTMWKSGWHMSSFLPNTFSFINKLKSYSHFNEYNKMSYTRKKETIIKRIKQNRYIFGSSKPMPTINVRLPETEDDKYPKMYDYHLWEIINEEYNNSKNGESETLEKLNKQILHELPSQVWQNPICYSYMLDRDFGFTKKLWWEIIPKEEWETIDFSQLNSTMVDLLTPFKNDQISHYIKNIY